MTKFHAQLWQVWKSARISETPACKVKTSSISTLWGRKGICGTFGTLATCQVSCLKMAILKIGPYLRNRYSWCENKLNFDPCGRKGVMWNFGKWPGCFSNRASRPMGLLFLCNIGCLEFCQPEGATVSGIYLLYCECMYIQRNNGYTWVLQITINRT